MTIGDIDNPTQLTYLQEALYLCIGEPSTQLFSLDGTKLLIKTNGVKLIELFRRYPNTTLPQLLIDTNTIEYSYEEITTILNGPEWFEPLEI